MIIDRMINTMHWDTEKITQEQRDNIDLELFRNRLKLMGTCVQTRQEAKATPNSITAEEALNWMMNNYSDALKELSEK